MQSDIDFLKKANWEYEYHIKVLREFGPPILWYENSVPRNSMPLHIMARWLLIFGTFSVFSTSDWVRKKTISRISVNNQPLSIHRIHLYASIPKLFKNLRNCSSFQPKNHTLHVWKYENGVFSTQTDEILKISNSSGIEAYQWLRGIQRSWLGPMFLEIVFYLTWSKIENCSSGK